LANRFCGGSHDDFTNFVFTGGMPKPRLTPTAAVNVPLTSFAGARVLAAEDGVVNRLVLDEALARFSIQATFVEHGAAAVSSCARRRFDLILMDVSMPGLDGIEATALIRADEKARNLPPVPIIALTAHHAFATKSVWTLAGMNGTLAKPFTLASLNQCLQKWIEPKVLAHAGAHRPGYAAPFDGDLPVLDLQVIADIRSMQAEGDDLVAHVIDLYCDHAPNLLARLETALAERHCGTIAFAAHALKSLSRNIGAEKFSATLDSIECTARAAKLPGDHAIVAKLQAELSELLSTLDALPRAPVL
jgi:CheY-like chemotaxis protein